MMGRIVQYLSGLPFQCSIVYTGQVFLFVTNQRGSCVDNTSKLYFILVTDIALARDYVKKIERALQNPVNKLENALVNIETFQLSQ